MAFFYNKIYKNITIIQQIQYLLYYKQTHVIISFEERRHSMKDDIILKTYFDTVNPLHLKTIPKKMTNKKAVLRIISNIFERDTEYSEQEVNEILKPIFDDFVLLRRYLVDYKYLNRTRSGSIYNLNDER